MSGDGTNEDGGGGGGGGETGVVDWVFQLIDSDADGVLSPMEMVTCFLIFLVFPAFVYQIVTAFQKEGNRALLEKAGKRALGGGVPGAIAMLLQVFLLMWLRTAMNFQVKNKLGFAETFKTLYADGGIGRFYKGLPYALISSPISRFGDTAANEGVKAFYEGSGASQGYVSSIAAFAAGFWRIFIIPVAAMKTSLQTNGNLDLFWEKIAQGGFFAAYDGAVNSWLATTVGYYPWDFVKGLLEKRIPQAEGKVRSLSRAALINVIATFVSDICSNSIRVVQAHQMTSGESKWAHEVVADIIEEDGLYHLFFGGLGIKMVSNTIQAILFAVLWKYLMGMWNDGSLSLSAFSSPFSLKVPANYASQALSAVMALYLFFGAFLMNFPDELMAKYGISIQSVLPDSHSMQQYQFPVKMFWAAYGVSMVTVAMALGAVSRCGDRVSQSLVCLGVSISCVVQILDTLFLSGRIALEAPISASPGMMYFNAGMIGCLAVVAYLGWGASGAELPSAVASRKTTVVNTLRFNIVLFALYGFGLVANKAGMYKAYMKEMDFSDAPGVKILLDHSLHQIGMMMLTMAGICELTVMSGHVATQYAVVRALSYSFICSLGLAAVMQNVLPLLNPKWANGVKFYQFCINLGMFLLNWKVASSEEKPIEEQEEYQTPQKKKVA